MCWGLSRKSPAIDNVIRTVVGYRCNPAAKENGQECACVNYDDCIVQSVGAVDTVEWARVLCGCCIQNDWESRATNLHQILHQAWTFLHRNYLDDSEGCSCGQLVIGSFIMTTCLLRYHILCSVFWWNIKSPRWLSPATAQIRHPVISGFSQN